MPQTLNPAGTDTHKDSMRVGHAPESRQYWVSSGLLVVCSLFLAGFLEFPGGFLLVVAVVVVVVAAVVAAAAAASLKTVSPTCSNVDDLYIHIYIYIYIYIHTYTCICILFHQS